MTAGLVGIAFTTPSIIVTVLDRDKFRAHLYHTPGALHAFLQEEDTRLPIVILSSVRDLKKVEKVRGVHSFILVEDPRALFEIEGAVILDAEPDEKYTGYIKKMIRPEDLNSALEAPSPFSFTQAAIDALGELSSDISFRELVKLITPHGDIYGDLPEAYETDVCMYQVRALQRRSWVSRVQRPGLKAGVPIEAMAEIEKYIDTSPSSHMLWRAYYDHAVNGLSVADVSAQYEVSSKDVDYLVSVLGDSDLRYCKKPEDSPLVVRKRRKVRKLKSTGLKGTSMAPKTKKTSSDSELRALLAPVEEQAGLDYSRAFCAFLGGLLSKKDLTSACKEAVHNGAGQVAVKALLSWAKTDKASDLRLAYCHYTAHVGVTASAAASEYSVSPADLKTVLHYKPLSFVCKTAFVRWPSEIDW